MTLFLTFQEFYSGCCTVAALGPPSRDAYQICTRLRIHAALLSEVNKSTESDSNSFSKSLVNRLLVRCT